MERNNADQLADAYADLRRDYGVLLSERNQLAKTLAKVQQERDELKAHLDFIIARIASVSTDFIPERESMSGIALDEMRGALEEIKTTQSPLASLALHDAALIRKLAVEISDSLHLVHMVQVVAALEQKADEIESTAAKQETK